MLLKIGSVVLFKISITKILYIKYLTVIFKLLKNVFFLQCQYIIHKKQYTYYLQTILQILTIHKIS